MLILQFSGWAICRLATDPDPYDDPRGNLSSFQQFAYAGEPDLDRIVRFQDPPFVRSHCWPIGVTVKSLARGGADLPGHAIVGARVELLGRPVFEGRNHVISNDAREPIHPFHLGLRSGGASVSRALTPADPDYPFTEMMPLPGGVGAAAVIGAIGIEDLVSTWQKRLTDLETDLGAAAQEAKPGLEERIATIRRAMAMGLAGGIFTASMRWRYALDGPVSGDAAAMFGAAPGAGSWIADFWFGGYDVDAQSFFCSGTLSVPEAADAPPVAMTARRARVMLDDRPA